MGKSIVPIATGKDEALADPVARGAPKLTE
jgi:hypothetical protein